jgi:hypothetical protein
MTAETQLAIFFRDETFREKKFRDTKSWHHPENIERL